MRGSDSRARPSTMADVARLAQVSAMTVSRVVSGNGPVKQATRERVEHAMQQLGFAPNAAARALVSGRSGTIGVITFDTSQYGPGAALLGIERAAREHGYGVSIATLPTLDRSSMTDAVATFKRRATDGVIAIVPHVSAAGALAQVQADLPVVAVQGAAGGELPAVAVDQRGGARAATDHLLGLGHRTVWHIAGPDDWYETRERTRGWLDALSARSAVVPPVVRGDWSAQSGYLAGLQLLDGGRDITAVFAANDQMALGFLHAMYERKVPVPERISVVGFDDIPEAAFFSPALTTVRQDFDEMGRRGVAMLITQLADPAQPLGSMDEISPELILRASTAAPPRA